MQITKDDMIFSYEVYGSGTNKIVILPGWGETKNTFKDMIAILQLEYTVYLFSYPGFDNNTFSCRDLTMENYCEAILSFFKTLGIKHPAIIAHSFGGRIALLLTSKYAFYVEKLILIDSAGIKPKKTIKKVLRGKCYHFLQNMANLLPKKKRNKAKHYLFSKFASSDYLNLKEEMRLTFQNIIHYDITPFLTLIQAKTLLLWGSNDVDTPLKDGIKMQKKIANSELIVFPRCGHFCYLENPYVIIRVILSFLEE